MVQGIQGEKDPRNLLVCFDLTHFLVAEYMQPTGALAKELAPEVLTQIEETFFDQVACYFPINFKPPKNNDQHRVTPEELRENHAKCMLASPLMLKHFVPFLLSKMAARQIETKVQTMEYLSKILQTFSREQLTEHDPQVLVQLLSEVSQAYYSVVDDDI